MRETVDVTFNFLTDTPPGQDPDSHSPTLRRYHRLLWSKTLPNGTPFSLDDRTPGAYLYHRSTLGEFFLTSDTAIPDFHKERSLTEVLKNLPDGEFQRFYELTYTIGGMVLFPGKQINRKMTLNGARGLHPRIKDRFDLTVECIRRYYGGKDSPLHETLARYDAFFQLFGTFAGYVEHFLLQDLTTATFDRVAFFAPFQDFDTSAVPQNSEEYRAYCRAASTFIEARNVRIRRDTSILLSN